MNVFDLFAKISLDTKDYEKNLKDAGTKFSGFADGLKSAVSKAGQVLLTVGKTAAAGIGAASTALAGLTKQSLDATADYEQLVGGVDKIFGESSKKVQEYANQAYQTAGLSANEYMETVTGFSASLLQSLDGDTKAAADIANRAIIDMSDNANTYGTDMQSIQNAYMGFSKQNYTMLDNLKLGYGGTKEEMERLIADASQMTEEMNALGVTVDADSMSFGNIINAISVMQEHMNIAGTTSKEAAGTISGSIASMKAAWKNFLTGTGSPEQFAESLKTSFGNIKNTVKKVLPDLAKGLLSLSRELLPEIPALIEEFLPTVITVAKALTTRLAAQLPDILTALLPALSQGVIDTSVALVQVLPGLITSLKEAIPIIVKTIWEKKDKLLTAGEDIISALFPENFDDVPQLISGAAAIITEFAAKITDPSNLKVIIDKGFELIDALIDGLTSEETLDQFFDPDTGVAKVIENLADALFHFVWKLTEAATKIIKNLGDYLNNEENRKQIFDSAKEIMIKIGKGLTSQEAKDAVGGLIVEAAKFLIDTFIGGVDWNASGADIAERIVKGFFDNVTAIPQWIGEQVYDATHEADLTELKTNGGHYAKGGVFTRPTYGLIGEDGAEVVMPLEHNTGWIDRLADRINSRGAEGGVTIGEITVNVTGLKDYEEIGDKIVRSIDEALKHRQITQGRGVGALAW